MSLRKRIMASEGLKLKAYPDPRSALFRACQKAGISPYISYRSIKGWQGISGAPWTLGYGRARGIKEGDTCTIDQAELWLDEDIAGASSDLERALPWAKTLDQPRHDVLVDMCFNMGLTTLLDFKRTLAAVHNGDWPAASAGMLASAWASQVGRRAVVLARIMRTGVDE